MRCSAGCGALLDVLLYRMRRFADEDDRTERAQAAASRRDGSVEHCCGEMATHLEHGCDVHPDPFDCPDAVVVHFAGYRAYGLPIHDGGSSSISIRYCPWCGARLPQRLDEEWEEEVRARGFDPDGDEGELPAELAWDTWCEARRSAR
jgi:hypothetical protein